MTVQDLALIRRAILRVIDDGDPKRHDGHGRFCNRWQLDDTNEDIANAQRLDFCNRVQELVTQEATIPGEVVQLGRVA